ncbi:unnamed protein product [Closterium sp. NIES-54]
MTSVFQDLLYRFVIVYFDHILIFSKTREQHLRDLDVVFKRLQENCLVTKGTKCEFVQQELEFLGHVISRDGIKINPAKIKTIQEWKSPTNVTELRSFMGFVNYVRRFIPNVVRIDGPLTDLLHKGMIFLWGKEAEAALSNLYAISRFPSGNVVLEPTTNFSPALPGARLFAPAPAAVAAPAAIAAPTAVAALAAVAASAADAAPTDVAALAAVAAPASNAAHAAITTPAAITATAADTDTTLPPLYVLVYVDDLVFATADTKALAHVKLELQKRHTCQTWVLQRFGFMYSSPQSTPLPIGHSLSAPPSDESVEPSGPYPELVGCLITSGMGLVLGGRARIVLTGHADASWVDGLATQRSSQGYTFSLGSGSVSWRSTRSSSVLSSSCEAEIYTGAMAAQELRWLTYLLTDLGEAPRSPPVLYVDNKAMLALCQEHRLEHRTKHIALRYFLARDLQRGQLRLAYVASQANTADVFTKALQPCDHQRFYTVLGLVPTVPHLRTS